jgi:hypothetical protein
MNNQAWFESVQKRAAILQERFTQDQLNERIGQLDQELRATGWISLSEKRKRGKLAKEITACIVAWADRRTKADGKPD